MATEDRIETQVVASSRAQVQPQPQPRFNQVAEDVSQTSHLTSTSTSNSNPNPNPNPDFSQPRP